MPRPSILAAIGILLITGTVLATNVSISKVGSDQPNLWPICVNEKYGYIDSSGRVVIEPQFDSAGNFHNNRALVTVVDADGVTSCEYIDATGKTVIPAEFILGTDFKEGLARVLLPAEKDGPTDKKGAIITDPAKWKHGYINEKGDIVIKARFAEALDFSEGRAAVHVSSNGKWGFIDKTGKLVIKAKYEEAEEFSEGLAAVQVNGKWGFIDMSGKMVISPKYGDVLNFSEGLAAVCVGKIFKGKYGYIDKSGRMVIPAKYGIAHSFSEGLAAVSTQYGEIYARKGFINKQGVMVIKPKYILSSDFHEGLAAVAIMDYKPVQHQSFGYINKKGEMVVTPQFFPFVEDFHGGLARVQCLSKDQKSILDAYIDRTGKFIWKAE